jgi:adenine-specific DNA-methyltransferase
MPELHFKGKEFVYNHHLTVPYRPLVPDPEKSVGTGSLDDNLIIHGDNLHALKALLPRYAGNVDCIFIDPPYNTGNESWSYNDNVNSPIMREWLNSNPVNKEDMLRHDKWCCMMWPRLQLLRELLSDDGSIFICVDDNEYHRLRCLADEIFGEDRFLGVVTWKTRNTDNRVTAKLSVDHEYVVVYSFSGVLRGRVIDRSDFANPDNDPRGDYVTDPLTGKATAEERPNLHYRMVNPTTGDIYEPDPSRGWITDEDGYRRLIEDNRIWWPPDPSRGKPRKKRFLFETEERMPISSFWGDVKGQSGADELDRIMGGRVFSFPKSLEFASRVIDLATKPNSIVLDSFAGSGTTAHAVLRANSLDQGSRRFILVECEDYAPRLTAERVKRVIEGHNFTGVQREELYRRTITWTRLQNAQETVQDVLAAVEFSCHEFDAIQTNVVDGVLKVVGVRNVEGMAPGLGGSFTFCVLGDPLDLDQMLQGERMPDRAALGAWLFHTATGESLSVLASSAPGLLEEWFLGESRDYLVWLIYRPDPNFLKSREAALTLNLAEQIAEAKPGKKHLVFAPSRFVPNKLLLPLGVEYAPLPFALYRVERA